MIRANPSLSLARAPSPRDDGNFQSPHVVESSSAVSSGNYLARGRRKVRAGVRRRESEKVVAEEIVLKQTTPTVGRNSRESGPSPLLSRDIPQKW